MKVGRAGVSMGRVCAGLAFMGTLIAVALHVEFGLNAGALWRDEVSSLNVATMPTVAELWANLGFDSFPALFFLVLRAFAGALAPVSDDALRVFGVVVGLLGLSAVWLNTRWLRLGFPLISLALIGFNPMVIRYGDSVRAYGLGILLVLLCLGTMWRFAEHATVGRALAALTSALLSVHSLYYNSFLLFAICCGATAVCLRRRSYRHAAVIVGIGAITAASLIPYVATIKEVGSTNFFWKVDFTAGMFWSTLADALGPVRSAVPWLWAIVFLSSTIGGAWCLLRHSDPDLSAAQTELLLYGLVTLVVGTAVYVAFLFHLSYLTRPWYFVVFIAFAAMCTEVVIAALPWKQGAFRCAFALLFITVSVKPAWTQLQPRQTNLDAVARHLQVNAKAGDLILLNTWNYELTLRRYYRGSAALAGIPPVEDVRTQRMDLVHRKMLAEAPIAPVLEQVAQTLRSGQTVWLVGTIAFVDAGRLPILQPPPHEATTRNTAFFRSWSEQAAFLVQSHAAELVRTRVPLEQPVMQYENVPLSAIRGWRESGDLVIR